MLAKTPLNPNIRTIHLPIPISIQHRHGIFITILCQIRESKTPSVLLLIIRMNQTFSIRSSTPITAYAQAMGFSTAASLHTTPCLDAGDYVGRDAVVVDAVDETVTFGVAAREVEQVDTSEDYKKTAEEGERVDYV